MSYNIVIKHPEDWDAYSEELANLFGFMKGYHPFIYLNNGTAIGGADEFEAYVKKNFNDFNYQAPENVIYNLTQENIKKSNEDHYTRKKGLTIREHINLKMNEVVFNEKYTLMNVPFKTSFDKGVLFYYKISDHFIPSIEDWVSYKEDQFIEEHTLELDEKLQTLQDLKTNSNNTETNKEERLGTLPVDNPEMKSEHTEEAKPHISEPKKEERMQTDPNVLKTQEKNDINNFNDSMDDGEEGRIHTLPDSKYIC